jgi:hypothetical protein
VESRNEAILVGNPCGRPTQSLLYWPEPTAARDRALPNFSARARRFRELQFAKGELVFARGDPGARPYLIAIDRVRVAL